MIIYNKDSFKKVVAQAKSMGNTSLADCLKRIRLYEKNSGCTYTIYDDHAPLSFYFVGMRGEQMSMNGGIIFHGPHDGYGSGSAPTFSICIDKAEIGWRIHT